MILVLTIYQKEHSINVVFTIVACVACICSSMIRYPGLIVHCDAVLFA